MICKACKNEIPDGSLFCNWCGKPQTRQSRSAKDGQTVSKPTRLASGEWSGQVMVDGVRRRVRAESEREYYAQARALKAGLIESRYRDNRLVSECVAQYIADREQDKSPATITGYLNKAKYNMQGLYKLRVCDLTKERVQAEIKKERGKYSGKTIREGWRLVSAATGVRFDGLSFPPSTPSRTAPVYSSDDLARLIQALGDIGGEVECAGLLAMWLSLRRSEILGLRWEDIDNDCIHVHTARVYDKEHNLVEKGTKNASSTRTIPCDEYILERLRNLPKNGEYIFGLTPSSIGRGITKACELAGIDHGYLHALRHTNATIMELLGVPSVYANRRGGWANDHVRKRIYTEVMDEGSRAVAETINGYMRGLIKEQVKRK